jgi:hypothetical protein
VALSSTPFPFPTDFAGVMQEKAIMPLKNAQKNDREKLLRQKIRPLITCNAASPNLTIVLCTATTAHILHDHLSKIKSLSPSMVLQTNPSMHQLDVPLSLTDTEREVDKALDSLREPALDSIYNECGTPP